MPRYEYKVVPAPTKAKKVKGLKGTDQRFASALAEIMNAMGADGWEYQRTDTLPCEERHGFTGKTTTFQNMLIFRRELAEASAADAVPATHETAPEPAAAVAQPQAQAAPRPSEPLVAVPAFRSLQQSAPVRAAAEGKAPKVGAASHPEPPGKTRAPDVATH